MPVGVFIDNEPAVRDRLKVVFFPTVQRQKEAHLQVTRLSSFLMQTMKTCVTPDERAGDLNWELMLDTSALHTESHTLEHLDSCPLKGRSLAVLRPKLPTLTGT